MGPDFFPNFVFWSTFWLQICQKANQGL